jgi:cysteine synthase A
MNVRSGFIDSIGNTPLIKLRAASAATGCDIYGKAEFLNPGGSVKDRAALAIIEDAEKSGKLRPGGVIVEGTAGNTDIGIALVANARGCRSVIVMPETQSREKKDMVRLCGADLRLVPAVPLANPGHFTHHSRRLAEELAAEEPNGAIWANQFDNTANRDGHYRTTGPEIWDQTDGKIDGFNCSAGTGGTLAGVARALKERNPNLTIALSDPMGSAFYNWKTKGELKAEGSSITEGIGNSYVTANLEGAPIDTAYRITDEEALPVLFDLVQHEGLILGGSTAINIVGAMRLACDLGPGRTIVTILADSGQRYQSKLFNPVFLREKNLPVPSWMDDRVG